MAQKNLFLRIGELVMGKVSPLFAQDLPAKFDPQTACIMFPRLEFMSD